MHVLNQTDGCFLVFSLGVIYGLITHQGQREDLGFGIFASASHLEDYYRFSGHLWLGLGLGRKD